MKVLNTTIIIVILIFSFGCKRGEIVDSSDPNTNDNTNIKFYIEYNIDGEKIRYEVDTVDMYIKNEYPSLVGHKSADDNLYFGNFTMNNAGVIYGGDYIGVLDLAPFGLNKSAYPKFSLRAKIPYFSDLEIGKSIINDTLTPINGEYHAEKFFAHLTKHTKPLVAKDTNTYDMYEAGVISSTDLGLGKNAVNKIKPSLGILSFKITGKKNITYKWLNMPYNVVQVDGEFNGKMRKYNSSYDNITYGKYVNVQIKFSLPVGRI
ncbi:MAG: hypothetical protein ACON5K_01270 [Bacteroidia bacterium]